MMADGPTLLASPDRGPLATVGYWDEKGEFRGVLIHYDMGLHHHVQARWNRAGWPGLKLWIDAGIERAGYRTAGSKTPLDRKATPELDDCDARDDRAVRSFHYLENQAFSAALVVSPWGVRSLEESIHRRWQRDEVLARHGGLAQDSPELRSTLFEVCSLLDHSHEERDYALAVLVDVDPAVVGSEGVQAVRQRLVDALERELGS